MAKQKMKEAWNMSYQKPHRYVEDFVDRVLGDLGLEPKREATLAGMLWVDYRVGKILIECEAPGRRGQGRQQLFNYMKQFGYSLGLLIDVPSERYYDEYPKPYEGRVGFELYKGQQCIYSRSYDRSELDKALEELKILLKTIHELRIASLQPKPRIVLGVVKEILGRWEKRLLKFVEEATPRVKTYLSIWKRNMELIYGRDVLRKIGNLNEIFVKLTIYITMLKVLGCTILETILGGGRYTIPIKLSQEGARTAIELFWERKVLTQFNINYLFERDEYDWVFDPQIAKQLDGYFKDIGRKILEIDWSQGIDLDLLKKTYQSIVPKDIRRLLGEYYTPDWIAKMMLWRALHILVYGTPPKDVLVQDIDSEIVELIDRYYREHKTIPRFIDPTCGSFTFGIQYINALLNWYFREKPSIHPIEFVKMILQNVVGVDLNPVATITAKVNYLLQIYHLLVSRGGYLTEEPMIPIYRIDLTVLHKASKARGTMTLDAFFGAKAQKLVVYIPLTYIGVDDHTVNRLKNKGVAVREVAYKGETKGQKHRVYYIELEIPKTLLSKVPDITKLHRAFLALFTVGLNGFEEEVEVGLSDEEKKAIEYVAKVVSVLEELGLDYVWHTLVMDHVLAILASQDRYDLVLGNLPWVNISKYPEKYREMLREIAKDLEIYPPGQAAKKLDISAILFAISAKYLLKTGGVIALMVPVSIFKGLHGARWRNFSTMQLNLLECFDLEDVKPFEDAENQPGIVFARREVR
ncbi:MAG TPA: hypothetical protein EYH08_04940 [Pyrodictium sp.]|nr:hypothetical protein [Pyrodictium sp.]